jgi:hypothetical protein
MHPAALPPDRLLADCDTRRARRSGPGGQHRNKVETAVVLTHRPTGIVAEANERRSHLENLEVATSRLRLKLAIDFRTRVEPGRAPSPLWQSRCRGARIMINPHHHDFPAVLAEALDVIAAQRWELKPAAEQLACTASQLLKLLKLEPRAMAQVNAHRARLDLHQFQ